MRLPYHKELEEQREFWRARAMRLEESLDELRAAHSQEMRQLREQTQATLDLARERELELFDKALKRHGSTTIRREQPPDVPPPLPSSEELAFAEDWVAEYLEVFPGDTPRQAAEYYRAYREGNYDPKHDPRLPLNFTTDGRSSQSSN